MTTTTTTTSLKAEMSIELAGRSSALYSFCPASFRNEKVSHVRISHYTSGSSSSSGNGPYRKGPWSAPL